MTKIEINIERNRIRTSVKESVRNRDLYCDMTKIVLYDPKLKIQSSLTNDLKFTKVKIMR